MPDPSWPVYRRRLDALEARVVGVALVLDDDGFHYDVESSSPRSARRRGFSSSAARTTRPATRCGTTDLRRRCGHRRADAARRRVRGLRSGPRPDAARPRLRQRHRHAHVLEGVLPRRRPGRLRGRQRGAARPRRPLPRAGGSIGNPASTPASPRSGTRRTTSQMSGSRRSGSGSSPPARSASRPTPRTATSSPSDCSERRGRGGRARGRGTRTRVVVRPLGTLVRISIGRREENDALVEALARVSASPRDPGPRPRARPRRLRPHVRPRSPGRRGAPVVVNLVLVYEEGSEASVLWGDERNEGWGEYADPGVQPPQRDPRHRGALRVRQPRRRLAAGTHLRRGRCAGDGVGRRRRTRAQPGGARLDARARSRPARPRLALDPAVGACRATRSASISGARSRATSGRSGERPLGWNCPSWPSESTRELLVEEGGFLYDSDGCADDIPYYARVRWEAVPRRSLLEDLQRQPLPHEPGLREPARLPRHARRWGSTSSCARDAPAMMTVAVHARWSGQAARAAAVRAFLEHARRTPGRELHAPGRHRALVARAVSAGALAHGVSRSAGDVSICTPDGRARSCDAPSATYAAPSNSSA